MCVGVSAWPGAPLGSGQIPLHSLELGSERGTQLPPAARTGQGLQGTSELPGGLSAPPQSTPFPWLGAVTPPAVCPTL